MGWFGGSGKWKLAAVAAVAALAAAGGLATPAATQAQATPIRHVVVIFLENQSFDSILGYWCDGQPGRCPQGGMPSSVRLSNGAVVAPGTSPDTVPNVNHSVAAQAAAIDGGKMDGWQNIPGGTCAAATGYRCISGYQPSRVPNITALARNFAISDHTFTSEDSASWAGHMDIVAASEDHFLGDNPVPAKGVTAGPGWGCDSNRVMSWFGQSGRPQLVPSCVPDHLPGLKFGGAFEQTPVKTIPTIMDRLDAAHLSWKLYGANSTQGGYIWSICPTFAECLDTSQHANLVPDAQFLTAAGAVPPGTNPDGTAQGPRVPLIIVSPFARPGFTDTMASTFAGILSYTEHTFGLSPLSPNDAAAYPFSNAFNYSQAPLAPARMVHRPLPASAKRIRLTPALENDPT